MSDELILPYTRIINIRDDVETIALYLQGKLEAELSPTLQDKLARLSVCAGLIGTYGSRHKVIPMMTNSKWKSCEGTEYSISEKQAFRDYNEAQLVYGVTEVKARGFWVDLVLSNILETKKKSIAAKDLRAAAMSDRNLQKAVADYFPVSDRPAYEDVQPPKILIGFYPELTKVKLPENWEALAKKLMQSKRKKNFYNDTAEDTAYEDVKD